MIGHLTNRFFLVKDRRRSPFEVPELAVPGRPIQRIYRGAGERGGDEKRQRIENPFHAAQGFRAVLASCKVNCIARSSGSARSLCPVDPRIGGRGRLLLARSSSRCAWRPSAVISLILRRNLAQIHLRRQAALRQVREEKDDDKMAKHPALPERSSKSWYGFPQDRKKGAGDWKDRAWAVFNLRLTIYAFRLIISGSWFPDFHMD